MRSDVKLEVKTVVCNSITSKFTPGEVPDDFGLAGDNLDSMAVTNLILALEEHFGFAFEDEELSVEAFETVDSLSKLVQSKLN